MQLPAVYKEEEAKPQLPTAPAPTSLTQETQQAVQETRDRLTVAMGMPRNEEACLEKILQGCKRVELAEKAEYKIPNRGSGPTIRLAEEIARHWRNFDYGFKVAGGGEGFTRVEVFAWDLENNSRKSECFNVNHIRYSKKNDVVQIKQLDNPDDIYNVISNRVSRRVRECILKIVPGYVVDRAITECRKTLEDLTDIKKTLPAITKAFKGLGVSENKLASYLGKGLKNITANELNDLRAIYSGIAEGTTTVDEVFGDVEPEEKPKKSRKKKEEKTEAVEAEVVTDSQEEKTEPSGSSEQTEAGTNEEEGDVF